MLIRIGDFALCPQLWAVNRDLRPHCLPHDTGLFDDIRRFIISEIVCKFGKRGPTRKAMLRKGRARIEPELLLVKSRSPRPDNTSEFGWSTPASRFGRARDIRDKFLNGAARIPSLMPLQGRSPWAIPYFTQELRHLRRYHSAYLLRLQTRRNYNEHATS